MAATAGLDQATGQAVVLMDADLQDPPEVILDMLEEYRRGYDVVYGRRSSRAGETRFKRLSAWLFYRTIRLLVHSDLPADVGDFRLVSRACLDAVCRMRETHRFLRGMIAWVGFPQTAVSYARDRRVAGKTTYPLRKMLWLAWTAAFSFSPTPLRLSFVLGFLIAAIGMLQAVNAVVRSFLGSLCRAGLEFPDRCDLPDRGRNSNQYRHAGRVCRPYLRSGEGSAPLRDCLEDRSHPSKPFAKRFGPNRFGDAA